MLYNTALVKDVMVNNILKFGYKLELHKTRVLFMYS